jgi:GPN-loop GTPase
MASADMEVDNSTASSSNTKMFDLKSHPVVVVVLGMAGSGKTTFVKKLAQLEYQKARPYVINLDPACREVPYPANIGEVFAFSHHHSHF